MERKKIIYVIVVMVGAISGGLVPTANSLAINAGLSESQVLLGQSGIGLLALLLLFILFKGYKDFPLISFGKTLIIGISLGLTGFFLLKALSELSASTTVILQFQFPWIGILIAAIYRKKMPSIQHFFVIAFILVGVVLGSGIIESGLGLLSAKGVMFGMLNAFSYALYIFLNDIIEPDLEWPKKGLGIACGVFIVVMLTSFSQISQLTTVPMSSLFLYGLLNAVVAILLPIICFSIGVPKIGSSLSSLVSSIELPAAIGATILFLGESVTLIRIIGVLIIIVTILYANRLDDT